MEISVTDLSTPIGASIFKFCVHLQVGKVFCVNANKDANPYFDFFFHFYLLSLLYNTSGHFFCQRFLSNYLTYDSEIWYKA